MKKTDSKTKARASRRSAPPCSATQGELDEIASINAAKKGKYIRMKCWTESNQSSAETAATSITAAVKFIRAHAKYHANWRMEFISEPNDKDEVPK